MAEVQKILSFLGSLANGEHFMKSHLVLYKMSNVFAGHDVLKCVMDIPTKVENQNFLLHILLTHLSEKL